MVGIASTPDGGGYWLAAADGGVFAFGDAGFDGSAADLPLGQPVVGIASTPDGGGYWLAAADGGVFAFGDAGFDGSAADLPLGQPVVGIASTPDGGGYWLTAADGGVFAFGDAGFDGSAAGKDLGSPVVSISAVPTGGGYRLVTEDGVVLNYGVATTEGDVTVPAGKVPVCLTSQLHPSLGSFGGTAGSVHYQLYLLNRSASTCLIDGYPSVAFVTKSNGAQVGAAAIRSPGNATSVLLSPGVAVRSQLQEYSAFSTSPSACQLTAVGGIRVYPPGRPTALYIAQPGSGCANAAYPLLQVGPLLP